MIDEIDTDKKKVLFEKHSKSLEHWWKDKPLL